MGSLMWPVVRLSIKRGKLLLNSLRGNKKRKLRRTGGFHKAGLQMRLSQVTGFFYVFAIRTGILEIKKIY